MTPYQDVPHRRPPYVTRAEKVSEKLKADNASPLALMLHELDQKSPYRVRRLLRLLTWLDEEAAKRGFKIEGLR